MNTIEVSQSRIKFLSDWRRERAIERLLDAAPDIDIKAVGEAAETAPKAVSKAIKAGEVWLLPHGSTSKPSLSYVAVLDRDDGVVSAAPFSPYSVPAYKDEWLTGLEARPLRVLQLWNVHPVPESWLARGWRVGAFSARQLDDARELYYCALTGRWADFPLREATGLAIHDPRDDRLRYQEEQLELYAPLRGIVWDHIERTRG